MKSAILDSAVAFKHAYDRCSEILALTFDYGQRASAKEIEYASMGMPCLVCESCMRRARAFAEVGVEDLGLGIFIAFNKTSK